MIMDADLLFSDAQAIPTGATTVSTNIVDLQAIRDIGVGEDLEIVVQITTALAGVGTVVVLLQSDDNSSFSSAVTAQTIGTFAAASVAGTRLTAKLQPGAIVERYIRIAYTAGTLSAGAADAFIAHGVDNYRSYADNITIS